MTEPTSNVPERVVSLAPSATATLTAMDAADLVTGVTYHCDHDAPAVGGWLNPDYEAIEALDPDLVLTCDALQADICEELATRGHETFHVEPRTLPTVLESFHQLGAAVGRPDDATALVQDVRDRLDRLQHAHPETPPVVYCEEWSNPPMAAGNWIPDAVRAAGGCYPFVDAGVRSREIGEAEVTAADPDHVVLHICGRGDAVDQETITERDWGLNADVHVVNDALLNQPSPRLVDGIETLAGIICDDA